jgi:phosphoribosylanthranilate isomerase
MRARLKVCCISSHAEARMAVQHGAAALGLVGHMPSGPGVIDDALIASIARDVPPPVATFLLTSEVDAQAAVDHARRAGTTTLQLVDEVPPDTYAALRAALPALKLVQVVHVRSDADIDAALTAAAHVDALLLDSGNPDAAVKELGGTGRTHNWSISRSIVHQSPKPVFLAGGINPGNVARALDEVQPFGIDLCSGVRTAGNLDPRKLEALIHAMR